MLSPNDSDPRPHFSHDLTQDRYGWYVCFVLFLAFSLAYADRHILAVLVEPLRADLGLTDTQISVVYGPAFVVMFALAGLPMGYLVDRYKRRNILVVGALGWTSATFACGLADSFGELLIARVAVGIGEACLAPAGASIIVDYFAPDRRGRATTFMGAGAPIGSALSLLCGGLILERFSSGAILPVIGSVTAWQLVFLLVALPGFLLVVLIMLIREPARQERVGYGEMVPFLPFFRSKRRAILLTYAVFSCTFMTAYAFSSWSPALLMRSHGFSPTMAATFTGFMLLGVGLIAGPIGGTLSDGLFRKHGAGGRFRVLFFTGTGQILFGLLIAAADWRVVVVGLVGLNFFGAMSAALCYQTIGELAPNELRGRAIAIYLIIGNLLGLGVAPPAVALVTERGFGDPGMLGVAMVSVGVSAAVIGLVFTFLGLRPYAEAAARR